MKIKTHFRMGVAALFALPVGSVTANSEPSTPPADYINLWVDAEGRDQLFPASLEHYGFNNPGMAISGGRSAISNGEGTWLDVNLQWPATKGAIHLEVSKVMMHIEAASEIRVEATQDNGESWIHIMDFTWEGDNNNWTTLIFDSVEADRVRFTNLGTGWFNINGIRFFGKVIQDEEAGDFASPGNLVTSESLQRIRNALTLGEHPAGVTLEMLRSAFPARPYKPNAVPVFFASPSDTDVGTREWELDSNRAFPFAFMYVMTGDPVYAENVIRIIDDWVTTSQDMSGGALPLQAGLNLGSFIMAADILRAEYPEWDPQFEKRFTDWIRDRGLIHSMETRLTASGENWTQNIIRTQLALSSFTRNRYQFDRHIEWWKRNVEHTSAPWGETFETLRDLEHAMMGVAAMVGAAEIAHNQGVDLYGWASPEGRQHANGITYTDADFTGYRLANIVEYHAQVRNVGQEVQPPPSNIKPQRDSDGYLRTLHQGKLVGGIGRTSYAGDEQAYAHYHRIKGIEVPELQKRIEFTRAEGHGDVRFIHSMGLGTFTHGQ